MTRRQQFEEWVRDSPFEYEIARFCDNTDESNSWPGQYVDEKVQLMWLAYNKGIEDDRKRERPDSDASEGLLSRI